jgi:septum formation protein
MKKSEIFSEITEVRFSKLSKEMISCYIDDYSPFDKAGGYGIQEWIGLIAIEKINGSYTNVVGLPSQKLFEKIRLF